MVCDGVLVCLKVLYMCVFVRTCACAHGVCVCVHVCVYVLGVCMCAWCMYVCMVYVCVHGVCVCVCVCVRHKGRQWHSKIDHHTSFGPGECSISKRTVFKLC